MKTLSRPPFTVRLAAFFIFVSIVFCTGLYALIHRTETSRLEVAHRDAAQSMADSLAIVMRSPIVAMDVAFVSDYSHAVLENNLLLVRAQVTLTDGITLFDSGYSSAMETTTVLSDVRIAKKVIGHVALSFDRTAASADATATAERFARTMCAAMFLLYATVAWIVQRQLVSPLEAIVGQLEDLRHLDDAAYSSFNKGIQPLTIEVSRCVDAINDVAKTLVTRARDAESLSEQLKLQISERNYAWQLTEDKSNQLAEAVNELRIQQARLVEAGELRAQQEVIRQIAHDLNNMLTPAVIATDMLQRDYSDKSENEQELISLIHSALSDAAHLVSVMKPLQSDTEPVGNIEELRPHSFADIWKECGRLASMQDGVSNSRIQLIFHRDQLRIPRVRVQFSSIRNAILNLVVNAFEQSNRVSPGDDPYRIDCSWQTGPSYLQINVSDNCGGVSAGVLPIIWKLGVSTKESKSETSRGLGLYNARSTLRRHGGDLYLRRNDPAQTTFTMVLPVEGSSNDEDQRPNCAGRTALVVDDEKDVRDSVTRLLVGCGVLVTAVGPESLAQVERNSYDLYLVDVRLGIMNGCDYLLNIIKNNPCAVFALMTAYEDDLTERQLFELQCVRVLSKPLTLAVLYDLLDSIPMQHAVKLKLLK